MKLKCLLSLALGVAANLLSAEQVASTAATTNALTLEVLVTEALENNPELNFYRAEIIAARGTRKSAGFLPNPQLSGSVGQKSVRGGGMSTEGVAWSVSVAQPFEWPGRIGLRKSIANRDLELAELGLERFRAALASRMRTLAYGLFAAQEKAAAAQEVAERFKVLREVLVQRDPAGLTPLLEARVIEATELNLQHKASDAALAAHAARLELNQLRGLAPDSALVIEQTQLTFRPIGSPQELLALARTNNFELRVRAIELAQQGFRIELAKNERYPSLAVGPSYSEERAGDRERIIGIGLSLPLPLWSRNAGHIEAAQARQLQAETSFHVAQRALERQLVEAALIYQTKMREMANWRPDAVDHFREAAEVADRHYRLGAVPISTYVELQKQYLEAVEGLLETKEEALKAAAQLELLAGLPQPLTQTRPPEDKK